MSVSNKDLVKKSQSILKELGHELPLGHVYELFSKLSGHNNFNVASAKGAVFAELIETGRAEAVDIRDPNSNLPVFTVKLKMESEGVELNKFYKVSASTEGEARKIMEEYIAFREGEFDILHCQYQQTARLADIESDSGFSDKNWELAYPGSNPFFRVAEIYPEVKLTTKKKKPKLVKVESRSPEDALENARKEFSELMSSGKKHCYWITEDSKDENGYIPVIVFEDHPQYFPMRGGAGGIPWYWGKTFDQALEVALSTNERNLSISREKSREIYVSSIRASVR